MSNAQMHNRQLPLAQRYEDEIHRQEVHDREKIMAEQCKAMVRTPEKDEGETTEPGTTLHVATYMQANPGPGAYAVMTEDGRLLADECLDHTTVWQLELSAMIAALERVGSRPGLAVIYTTGRLIAQHLANGQAERWRNNGWTKADGDPVAHPELWKTLLAHYEMRCPSFESCAPSASVAMKRCAAMAKRTFQSRKAVSGCRP